MAPLKVALLLYAQGLASCVCRAPFCAPIVSAAPYALDMSDVLNRHSYFCLLFVLVVVLLFVVRS